MILGFKTAFTWGEPTHFVEKILKQPGFRPKTHTLRENFRFYPGIVINFATGVRTKRYKEFYRDTCKSTQTVVICRVPNCGNPFVFVDGCCLNHYETERLALTMALILLKISPAGFPNRFTFSN